MEQKSRISTANLNIPTPNQSELQKWVNEWHKGQTMENYREQESSLNKLFHRTYPRNDDLDDILAKVATLNDFYSTNIFNIFAVAKHIKGVVGVDLRLQNGDENLVGEIATVSINGKVKHFYSFATKFCSHHNEADFAIYDSYVEKMLLYFQKRDRFGDFKGADLRDYGRFKKALNDFKAFYGLDCNLKQLDMYLWQAGKKHFSKYKK
ncbi:hypothetical protein [Helicobacter sp. 23-1045]